MLYNILRVVIPILTADPIDMGSGKSYIWLSNETPSRLITI
jgi:hypothetical protein